VCTFWLSDDLIFFLKFSDEERAKQERFIIRAACEKHFVQIFPSLSRDQSTETMCVKKVFGIQQVGHAARKPNSHISKGAIA